MSGELRVRTRNMRIGRPLQASNLLRIGFVVLAIVVALVAGGSSLVYPWPYSPLIVGGAAAAAVAGIALLRKPAWALYAAVFVILLPTDFIPSHVHSILNRAITVVALATWLFDVLTQHRRVQWTITTTFMLGFLAWSLVTLLWAESLSRGMTIMQTYALRLILFLFLIPTQIRTREKLDGLMNTLALNGWVLMVASASTLLLGGYTPGTRLRVLGMNENEMGILALVTMIGVLWLVMQPSPQYKRLKVLAAWTFLLGTIGLVAASGSRGSAISLLVTLLAFSLWKPTRRWGVMGLLVLALGAVLAPFVFSTIVERFAIVRGDTFLGGREALWQATWKVILDHPWSGVGIGNARYAVMPHVRLLSSVLGLESAAVHNPVLTIWAETGILGILLYLGVLGSAVWSLARQVLQRQGAGARFLVPYFALVSSVFLGYMASWIKGGGMDIDHLYFFLLALLLVPASLEPGSLNKDMGINLQLACQSTPSAKLPNLRRGVK